MESLLVLSLFFLTTSILTVQTSWCNILTAGQLNSVFKHSGESSDARRHFPSMQKAATMACVLPFFYTVWLDWQKVPNLVQVFPFSFLHYFFFTLLLSLVLMGAACSINGLFS